MASVLWPIVTLSAYLAFVAAAVWITRTAGGGSDRSSEASLPLSRGDLLFIVAATLFILISRLPILQLSRDLQPDEAQFSANAIMAAHGWLNWDTSDSGSSGPLNVMIQAWPLLFGLDITFTTMHLTGAILACVLSALIYLGLRVEFGRIYALLFSLPVVLFLGASTYWDLIHTSSLYLPLSMTSFGVLTAVIIWRRPNPRLALAAAVALGSVVLTKLQVAPLALFVGVALLVAHVKPAIGWGGRLLRALPVVVAALLPLTLSVLPLVFAGHLDDFLTETVRYSTAYVSSPINPLKWLAAVFSIPMLAPVVALFAAAILIGGWTWLATKAWRSSGGFTWFALGLSVMAVLCIMSSGKANVLYLLFLVATLPFTAAALTRETFSHYVPAIRPAYRSAGLLTAGIALAMLPSAVIEAGRSPAVRNNGALIAAGMRFESPHILQSLQPRASDSLIVYGYMPYFYLLAGMQPGTRETWGENVILDHKRGDRESYRRRFIAEMDERHPAIIVDAVTFTDHVYRDSGKQGPRAFPALAERLDRDYVRISHGELEEGCPQTYLLRERAESLAVSQVDVAEVRASGSLRDESGVYGPEHVIDRDVFESCVDRWLAPPAAPATLDLILTRSEQIGQVSLLNTRGRWRAPDLASWSYEKNIINNIAAYHAARHAVVRLMHGATVLAEQQVAVDAYPYWTHIDFGAGVGRADHVVIEFPDWRGRGPGLNEVALYRTEQNQNTASLPAD